MSLLFERIVNLEIEKTYETIKTIFTEKGCKIIFEQSPNMILLIQGSLWGISPGSAKKKIQLNLESVNSKTKVASDSRLSSDWKNITLIGCILAALLVSLCLWMANDLNTFILTQKQNFWSWLVTVDGNIDFQTAQTFVYLTKILAIFLSVIILAEIVIAIYAHARKGRFSEKTLKEVLG